MASDLEIVESYLKRVLEWEQFAEREIHSIGWNRAKPSKVKDWPPYAELSKGWLSWCSFVSALLSSCCPTSEVEPIQNIWAAVDAWHRDHNAKKISPQEQLFDWLGRALIATKALRTYFHSVAMRELGSIPIADGPDPDRTGYFNWSNQPNQIGEGEWELAEKLWPHKAVEVATIAEQIYGDYNGKRSVLDSRLSRLRKALIQSGIPVNWERRRDRIYRADPAS